MKQRKSAGRTDSSIKKNELTVQHDPTLGREVQTRIGEQLRAIYDDVVQQGVPDRFADLLKRLDDQDRTDRS
jgi:hypothetical protein